MSPYVCLLNKTTSTVTGQSNWGFYHIWVWWPSWSCYLETLLTSAEYLLSGLCILLSANLVHLKKYIHYKSMVDNGMPGALTLRPPGAPLAAFIKESIIFIRPHEI